MASRRFRSIAFKVHAWLGIHVFAILALLSLTGSLTIYAHQIESAFVATKRLETPQSVGERASFGKLYDNARAYHADGVVTQIKRGPSDGMADSATMWLPEAGKRQIWFGGENNVVSREGGHLDLFAVIRDIHVSLFTRTHVVGVIVAAFSVILTAFLITGIITYRRFWRGYFRWPSRKAGARAYWGGMHRLTAVWSLPFLVLISASGLFYLLDRVVTLSYQDVDFAALADRDNHLPTGFDGAALDTAVAAAEAAIPGLHVAIVNIPGKPHEGIYIFGDSDTLLTGHEGNRVLVDPTTLAVIETIPASELNMNHRIAEISDQFHFGTFGGAISEALWALFGVLSTVLFIAGAMVYASRIAEPDAQGGASRRIWSASVLTKFGYPLMIFGLLAVAVLRFVI